MSADGRQPTESISVLVVDDQPHFRSVMRDVVAAAPGFELVGEAGSGEDAIEVLKTLMVQFVILDKRMPGLGGPAACRAITEQHPGLVVVLCSVEDPDSKLADDCGAAVVVRKQHLNHRLLAELWNEYGRARRARAAD